MHEHNITPNFNSNDKGTNTNLKQPCDLNDIDNNLLQQSGATPHAKILQHLIEQLEQLDFYMLAFPQVEKLREQLQKLEKKLTNPDGSFNTDKSLEPDWNILKALKKKEDSFQLNNKHFLVISIENIRKVAKDNRWGLCKNHDFIYLYNGTFWAEIDKETFQK